MALPREVDDWADAADMDLEAFVMQALRDARARNLRYEISGGTFDVDPSS